MAGNLHLIKFPYLPLSSLDEDKGDGKSLSSHLSDYRESGSH